MLRNRLPVAWKMALLTAAATPTMPIFSTPLPGMVVLTARRHVTAIYGGPSRVVEEYNPLPFHTGRLRLTPAGATSNTVVWPNIPTGILRTSYSLPYCA